MRPPGGSKVSKWRPATSSRSYPSQPSSVALTASTRPSSASDRKPQGALFSSSSMRNVSGADSGVIAFVEIILDDSDRLFRVAHVRAVARRLQHAERALRQTARKVLAHLR